jgi:hypothetical protein
MTPYTPTDASSRAAAANTEASSAVKRRIACALVM